MLDNHMEEKSLIELLGLEDLPPEAQKDIVTMAIEIVETRMIIRVLDRLDEKDKEEFGTIMEKEDNDSLQGFLEERKIDIGEIVKEEVLRFKKETMEELLNGE